MKAEFRFPLLKSVQLEDCWLLDVAGATIGFEKDGSDLNAIIVTFRQQSYTLAPLMTASPEKDVQARISLSGFLEEKARKIVIRFRDYINLFFSLEIITDDIESKYTAESDEEREHIKVLSIELKKTRPQSRLPFNVIAQAFFAAESDSDLSFASHLSKAARNAQSNHHFIDAFRYGFLLIEAVFGKGNFKSKSLLDSFIASPALIEYINETIQSTTSDKPFSIPEAVTIVKKHNTAESLLRYLVQKRGFYFHGNLASKDTWHPGQHETAKGVARIVVDVACQVAGSYGDAMFGDEIAKKHFDNALAQGAIMKVDVEFLFFDESGIKRKGWWEIQTTGTVMSNSKIIEIHRDFLERASVELTYCKIISVRAFYGDKKSILFSSDYIICSSDAKIE